MSEAFRTVVAFAGEPGVRLSEQAAREKVTNFLNLYPLRTWPAQHLRQGHQDRAGNLWAATQAGLDRLAGGRFVPFTPHGSNTGHLFTRFAEDTRGNLYVADSLKVDQQGYLMPPTTVRLDLEKNQLVRVARWICGKKRML